MLHLLFHPVHIVGVDLLGFTGADIGNKGAVSTGGHTEYVKNAELGIPFHFQVEGHLGRVVAGR
jgi:hypothetical protein